MRKKYTFYVIIFSGKRKGEEKMFKFELILPIIYGLFTSSMIIKYELLNLDMNLVTWCVYFLSIFIAYILFKLGGMIDKCLEYLF
jgi:hypothetical protein